MADPPSRKGKGTGKRSKPPEVSPENPAVNNPISGRGAGVIHDCHAPPPYQSQQSYGEYYPSPPPTRGGISAPAAPSRQPASGGQAGPSAPAQMRSQVAGSSGRQQVPAATARGAAMPGACIPAAPIPAVTLQSIPQPGASSAPAPAPWQEAAKKKKKKKKKRETGFETLMRTLTGGSKRRHKKKKAKEVSSSSSSSSDSESSSSSSSSSSSDSSRGRTSRKKERHISPSPTFSVMSTEDIPEQVPEIADVVAQPQPGPSAPRAAPAPGAISAPVTGATATPGTGASAAPAVGAIAAPAGGANQALESRVKTESVGGANAAPAAPVTGRQIFGSGEPEVQYLGARPRVPNQGDDLANNLFKEKMHYSSNISLIKSVMLPKILIFVTSTPHQFS